MSTNLDQLLDEDIFTENQPPQGRPAFLTVLCILSWVGCGVYIIYGFYKLWAYSISSGLYDAFDNPGQTGSIFNTDIMGDARKALEYGKMTTIAQLIGTALILPGTILMWNLKKIGFFIYAIAQIAPIALYVVLMSGLNLSALGGFWAFWGWIAYLPDLICIGFVVMYGLNLKHMR